MDQTPGADPGPTRRRLAALDEQVAVLRWERRSVALLLELEAVALERQLAGPHQCSPELAQRLEAVGAQPTYAFWQAPGLPQLREAMTIRFRLLGSPQGDADRFSYALCEYLSWVARAAPADLLDELPLVERMCDEAWLRGVDRENHWLAEALGQYAYALLEADLARYAVAPASRAVGLLLGGAGGDRYPTQYELVGALDALATGLAAAGRMPECLACSARAVRVAREMDPPQDDETVHLGWALGSQAELLLQAGLRDEALVPAREAVALYEEVLDGRAARLGRDHLADCEDGDGYIRALGVLAECLMAVGQHEEAARMVEHADRMQDWRDWFTGEARDDDEPTDDDLADIDVVDDQDPRRDEEMAALLRATGAEVETLRRSAGDGSVQHLGGLASALAVHREALQAAGRGHEAWFAAAEGVAVARLLDRARELAGEGTARTEPAALEAYVRALMAVEHWAYALDAADELVRVGRGSLPDGTMPDLAAALALRRTILEQLGRADEADADQPE